MDAITSLYDMAADHLTRGRGVAVREARAADTGDAPASAASAAPPTYTRLAGYRLGAHVSWPIGLSDGYAGTDDPPRACGHITGLRQVGGRPVADLAVHDDRHRPTGETANVPTGYVRRVRAEGVAVREAATGGPANDTARAWLEAILGSGRR